MEKPVFEILLTDRQGNVTHDEDFQGLTESQAEKICEMWGWSYDDGCERYGMQIAEMR